MPGIPATWKVEIRRIGVRGQKVSETPSQQMSWGMVAHTCHPSYMGSIGRRIAVPVQLRQKARLL
jgi:hypothetical protein